MDKDRLHKDLIKLGDMMGDGLHYEDPWIAKEYRKTAKALYPEMYPKKQRKPTQRIIKTLKVCNCGAIGWTFKRFPPDKVQLYCKGCDRHSEIVENNSMARDSWNASFNAR
jgi:ribosomal protein L44E